MSRKRVENESYGDTYLWFHYLFARRDGLSKKTRFFSFRLQLDYQLPPLLHNDARYVNFIGTWHFQARSRFMNRFSFVRKYRQ